MKHYYKQVITADKSQMLLTLKLYNFLMMKNNANMFLLVVHCLILYKMHIYSFKLFDKIYKKLIPNFILNSHNLTFN